MQQPGGANKAHVGGYSGLASVYRLNTSDSTEDYYLVDVTFAQTPNIVYCSDYWTCVWENNKADLVASLKIPGSTTSGIVYDISPQTLVQKTTETISTGAKLSGKVNGSGPEGGGEVSAGWSRTITTNSVDVYLTSSVGTSSAAWHDNYNWSASTSIHAFTSARLAIFSVPCSAIYKDDGSYNSLSVELKHDPAFYAHWWWKNRARSNGNSGYNFSFDPPMLNVSPKTLNLRPGESGTINVTAQNKPLQKSVKYYLVQKPNFVTTDLDSAGRSGNAVIHVNATTDAKPGSTDYYTINTNPPGGADAVRNGSLQVTVNIVH